MSTHDLRATPPARRRLARIGFVSLAGPLITYAVVRPQVSSDALALGAAGAIPLVLSIASILVRRKLEPLPLLVSIAFAIASGVALLSGSALPLKLHEAAITFGIGIVLLIAVAIGRPLPLHRVTILRAPDLDSTLGAMIGSFLVLHALVHLILALELSTSAWLVASKATSLGMLAAGIFALRHYIRRVRDSENSPAV